MLFNAFGLVRVVDTSPDACQHAMQESLQRIHTTDTEQCHTLKVGMIFGRSRLRRFPDNFHGLGPAGIRRIHFKVDEILLNNEYGRVKIQVYGGGRLSNGNMIRVKVHTPTSSATNHRPMICPIYVEGQSFWVTDGCILEMGEGSFSDIWGRGSCFCVVGLRVLPDDMSSFCKDPNCMKLFPTLVRLYDTAASQRQHADTETDTNLSTKKLGAMFQLIKGSASHFEQPA